MAAESCFIRFWANNFYRESYIVPALGPDTADTHLAKCQIYLRDDFPSR